MAKNIIPIDLTTSAALRQIRELVKDSANIFLIPHARQSMKKRHITLAQVIDCLRKGSITEGPYRDIGSGNWRIRMEYYTSGQYLTVVAEIFTNNNNEKILVITTFMGG